MTARHNNLWPVQSNNNLEFLFTAKSGLTVNAYDDTWIVLPHKGKGWQLPVGWVHSSEMPEEDRRLIHDVFMFYARTKVASTVSGIITNVKPFMTNGIPSLSKVKAIWSGLRTNNKKGLNQFFGALAKQGNRRFDEYHKFTSTHLDKTKNNVFDPSKGAFSDIEFDSLAKQINNRLREFDWSADRELSYYQSKSGFGELRNRVTNKLLISIVRRPIQIALLKWADAIPAGTSFHDAAIRASDEIGTLGSQTLQLRVFIAKARNKQSARAFPERYPLHLSEELSRNLIQYKGVFLNGVKLLLESSGIKVSEPELVRIANDMPMFPSTELFCGKFGSIELFRSLFTLNSTAYHVAEAAITTSIRHFHVASERITDCVATSNRVRHTVLTRGAQDGLPAVQLAKMTGVTVPAARHYVDLDYKARRLIDSRYIGNAFLKQAFSAPITAIPEGDECIFDNQFNPVGGARDQRSCATCSTAMGRPLGCYGCPNFRPILEANHRAVLAAAEDKLAANRSALINPLLARSVEKLKSQIEWVKCTIAICDEILANQRAIDAE